MLNVYSTTKQKPIPRAILKKMLSSYREKNDALKRCAERKMGWERGWQLKSCIHLSYFHFCSFATGMANMSPNVFISKVLLKSPEERLLK